MKMLEFLIVSVVNNLTSASILHGVKSDNICAQDLHGRFPINRRAFQYMIMFDAFNAQRVIK